MNYNGFTIPGENLKRLRDTDLEISGDTSERFSASLTPIITKFSGGVFCDGTFGSFVCLLMSLDAKTASFESEISSFFGFRTVNTDFSIRTGPELGTSSEGRDCLGFWEAKSAFWVWRSKKCWMPNLEGCGWLFGFDFFDANDADEDEEFGFFLGAILRWSSALRIRVFN